MHKVPHCIMLQHIATHCNNHCNTLQHTLQHTATMTLYRGDLRIRYHTATHPTTPCNTHCKTHCNALQHTLQHTATLALSQRDLHVRYRADTLQHTLQYSLQHTATHCNTLQHTVTLALNRLDFCAYGTQQRFAQFLVLKCIVVGVAACCSSLRCSMLQCVALQDTATQYQSAQPLKGAARNFQKKIRESALYTFYWNFDLKILFLFLEIFCEFCF